MAEADASAVRSIELTLMTRRDCPLCEDFHAALLAWVGHHTGVDVRVVDVDNDPALAAHYGIQVPVLLHGTTAVCSVHFRAEPVTGLLARL